MMKLCKTINLQEPQCNRNATANFVNLIMTSTVKHPIGRWRYKNTKENLFAYGTIVAIGRIMDNNITKNLFFLEFIHNSPKSLFIMESSG